MLGGGGTDDAVDVDAGDVDGVGGEGADGDYVLCLVGRKGNGKVS